MAVEENGHLPVLTEPEPVAQAIVEAAVEAMVLEVGGRRGAGAGEPLDPPALEELERGHDVGEQWTGRHPLPLAGLELRRRLGVPGVAREELLQLAGEVQPHRLQVPPTGLVPVEAGVAAEHPDRHGRRRGIVSATVPSRSKTTATAPSPGGRGRASRHDVQMRAATWPFVATPMSRRAPRTATGRRPCPGHLAVSRTDVPPSIRWWCTSCGDEGVISGWEQSPFDLRSRGTDHRPARALRAVIPSEVAATLRSLMFLDAASERLVFRASLSDDGIVIAGDQDDLEDLIDSVAAEANHEDDRRRQKRLDAALDVLNDALEPA